jgi:hypothetical protein
MRFRSARKSSLLVAGVVAGMAVLPFAAMAGGGVRDVEADVEPVPHSHEADGGSNVNGEVEIERDGGWVTVEVEAWGLAPKLPHAQHVHGVGDNECPDKEARDDRKDDGLIDTTEGAPDYGPIVVSLTTKGDASPASGLAVDRFPVADKHGKLHYERTFKIGTDFSRKIARNLTDFHYVVHGIDTNHNDAYDFSAGKSELDPSLPQEATVPAGCGINERD